MSPVKVKGVGGRQGIIFVIDLNRDIADIEKGLRSILKETEGYLSENALNLSYVEVEECSFEKKKIIQKIIIEEGFLIATDTRIVEVEKVKEKQATVILRTSLRAGAKFTFDGNVILFGDVKEGSRVQITGSFVCIGKVNGIVSAGVMPDGSSVNDAVYMYAREIRSPRVQVKNEKILNLRGTDWLHKVE